MEFSTVPCYFLLYSLQYWEENDLKLNTESFAATASLGWWREKKVRGLNRSHTMTIILNPPKHNSCPVDRISDAAIGNLGCCSQISQLVSFVQRTPCFCALEFRDLLIKCTEIKILSAKIGRTQGLQPNLSEGGRQC